MIKVKVYLSNDYDSQQDEVEITKEEILQIAANKVKGKYLEGHWTYIYPNEDIQITLSA